jgi:hypothetical protein
MPSEVKLISGSWSIIRTNRVWRVVKNIGSKGQTYWRESDKIATFTTESAATRAAKEAAKSSI